MSKLTKMLDKYRSMDTVAVRAGIMGDKTYPDGTKIAHVGYWNDMGTPTIPARPFFRQTIANNKKVLPQMIASLIRKGDSPELVLKKVGQHMVDEFTESVQTWREPPNAPSTIRAKGYNAPLRGPDRLLRNSFSYEIEQ